MSDAQDVAMVNWQLTPADAQLVMQILGQALVPYQRLAQVMNDIQRQAREANNLGPLTPHGMAMRANGEAFP